MRLKKRESTDRETIDQIIMQAQVVHLGLSDDGQAYIVPMSFGYDGHSFYVHCAKEGKKLDIIRKNDRVCFELEIPLGVVKAETACGWSMNYQSVMGEGKAVIISDNNKKADGLRKIMAHYSAVEADFPEDALERVCVLRIDIGSISGKQRTMDSSQDI